MAQLDNWSLSKLSLTANELKAVWFCTNWLVLVSVLLAIKIIGNCALTNEEWQAAKWKLTLAAVFRHS